MAVISALHRLRPKKIHKTQFRRDFVVSWLEFQKLVSEISYASDAKLWDRDAKLRDHDAKLWDLAANFYQRTTQRSWWMRFWHFHSAIHERYNNCIGIPCFCNLSFYFTKCNQNLQIDAILVVHDMDFKKVYPKIRDFHDAKLCDRDAKLWYRDAKLCDHDAKFCK